MTMLEDITFNINTDFVVEKEKSLNDLYDGKDWFIKLKEDKGDVFVAKTFSGIEPNDVSTIISYQLTKNDSATDIMTFEELTMFNDICAWILERRANDINSGWTWDKEDDYDKYIRDTKHDIAIADYAFDKSFSFACYLIEKFKYDESVFDTTTIDKALDDINVKKFFTADSKLTVKFLKEVGSEDWSILDGSKTSKSQKYYHFLVGYNGYSINVEYEGYAAKGQRRKVMCKGLIDKVKALKRPSVGDVIKEWLISNPWPSISDLMNNISSLDFERRENKKEHKDAEKAKDIRKFNRAADCTGMVQTIQQSALAYTKAGYSLTSQGLEPLSSGHLKIDTSSLSNGHGTQITIDVNNQGAFENGYILANINKDGEQMRHVIKASTTGDFVYQDKILSLDIETERTNDVLVVCDAVLIDEKGRGIANGSTSITVIKDS